MMNNAAGRKRFLAGRVFPHIHPPPLLHRTSPSCNKSRSFRSFPAWAKPGQKFCLALCVCVLPSCLIFQHVWTVAILGALASVLDPGQKGFERSLFRNIYVYTFLTRIFFLYFSRREIKIKIHTPSPLPCQTGTFPKSLFLFFIIMNIFFYPSSLFKRRKKDIRPGGIRNDRENPLKREAHLFDPKVAPWRKVERRRRRLKEIRLPKGMDGWMKKHNTEKEEGRKTLFSLLGRPK